MRTKVIIFFFLILSVTVVCIFPSILGTYHLKYASWEEEAYIGRPLGELQEVLSRKDSVLTPMHEGSIYPTGDRRLAPGREVMMFRRGVEYRWFVFGRAINLGYVIVEKRDDETIVVEILREDLWIPFKARTIARNGANTSFCSFKGRRKCQTVRW